MYITVNTPTPLPSSWAYDDIKKDFSFLCPFCRVEQDTTAPLEPSADGTFFCPHCDTVWTQSELARTYAATMTRLCRALDALERIEQVLGG